MANVIGIIQLAEKKGRSTLATNLSGLLAKDHSVVLIDANMQNKTSSIWAQKGIVSNLHLECAFNAQELIAVCEDVMFENDFVVIDASNDLAMTRAILMMSDLCLVPCSKNAKEGLNPLIASIQEANMLKPNRDIRIIWNQENKEAISDWTSLNTSISDLKAYENALLSGGTVFEQNDSQAKKEIAQFVSEVKAILEAKPKRKVYFRQSRY